MPALPDTGRADLVAAVVHRYADRVHDAVLAAGAPAALAPAVVERAGLAAIDAAADAEAGPTELLAGWFGRAAELATHPAAPAAEPAGVGRHHGPGRLRGWRRTPRPAGRWSGQRVVLAAAAPAAAPAELRASVSASVAAPPPPALAPDPLGPGAGPASAGATNGSGAAAALASLPPTEQLLLRLRDRYDLAPEAVAEAAGVPVAEVAGRLAEARLALLARHENRSPRRMADGHRGPGLDRLGQLAEGRVPAAEAVAIRTHVVRCPGCEQLLDELGRARRMVAALPLRPLSTAAHAVVVDRLCARGERRMCSLEEALLGAEPVAPVRAIRPVAAAAPSRGLSWPAVVLALAVALIFGVLVGLLTSGHRINAGLTASRSAQWRAPSISATRNASSSAWVVLSRGSQAVS